MKTDHNHDTIAHRIKMLVGDGSVSAFASKCGLLEGSIRQYLAGSVPGTDKLVAMARGSGVRIEWLATGEGPMRSGEAAPAPARSSGIDRDLLAQVHKGIAEVYRSENARISADPLADEVARIYDELVETYSSPEKRLVGLDYALNQLRRQLRAPSAPGSTNSKQAS